MPPDLVLLHGFAQTGASWEPVMRALAGSYRAIAPDLRGHGSGSALRPVSFDAITADIDGLASGGVTPAGAPMAGPGGVTPAGASSMAGPGGVTPAGPSSMAGAGGVTPGGAPSMAGPGGVTLAGYSMGGRIALHYALARPGWVARLVLVGASPGLADAGERAARREADEALAERIEQDGVAAFAEEWEAQPIFAGRPPAVAEAARADRLRNDAAGLAAALRGLGMGAMEPLWDRLGEVGVPVRLVVGERDAKFRAIAERMAELLPDVRVVVVQAAGHAAHLERPAIVAEAIDAG